MKREIGHEAAARFREKAAASRKRREESFDRCDTDGFLSQWADDISARLLERCAEIAENDGLAVFVGLYDIRGEGAPRRVAAKEISTRYGNSWLLDDAEVGRYWRRFIPTGDHSRIQRKLDLIELQEYAPAWAMIMGNGNGLSGCASAYVGNFRVGDKWGLDAVLAEKRLEELDERETG